MFPMFVNHKIVDFSNREGSLTGHLVLNDLVQPLDLVDGETEAWRSEVTYTAFRGHNLGIEA